MNWEMIMEPLYSGVVATMSVVIATAVLWLRRRLASWIEAVTTREQQELLMQLGTQAFAFAETVFNEYGGREKLKAAIDFVDRQLAVRGIELDYEQIRAAVEKAVLEHNIKAKKSA